MKKLENKVNILKIRISNLIDEHADALSEAQEYHKQLQEALNRIAELEENLRNKDVQAQPKATIIEHTGVEPSKN